MHFAPTRANLPEIIPGSPNNHSFGDEAPIGSSNDGIVDPTTSQPSPPPDATMSLPARLPNVTPEPAAPPPALASSPKSTQDSSPELTQANRPSRRSKPNPKYDPAMWDLTSVELSVEGEIKDYSLSDNPSFWPLPSKQRQEGGVRLNFQVIYE